MSELEGYLLKAAVEELLRKSADDWKKFLVEQVHLDIDKIEIPWNDVVLIIQYRHLDCACR